jgi:hypothetical protein
MCSPFISGLKYALAFSLAFSLVGAPSAQTQTQTKAPDPGGARLSMQKSAQSAGLSLSWAEKVSVVESSIDGQEIKLRFSRPLGTVPLDKAPAELAGWMDNVLYGYDSVLLVAGADVIATVEKRADGVRVVFTRKPPTKAALDAKARADQAAGQRLGYLSAAADMEEGKVRKARAALNELVQRDPRDVQSVQLLAGAEERLGRWRDALRLSNYALTFTPGEPGLVRNKARLLHTYGDFVRTDYDVFAVRNADTQRVSKATGRQNVGSDGLLTYTVERRRVDADKVTRADGTVTPFHGFRSQATMAYVQDWRDLQSTKISLFAADATLGAGFLHERRGDEHVLRFGGHWREPAYSLLEGVVVGGRRSRVFTEAEKRLSRRWLASMGGGINSYGLDGQDGQLASSATVNASLTYIVNEGDPSITVGYLLDAEYVIDNKFFTDSFGSRFHPMSLASREVHSLLASFERPLTDYLSWSATGGYSWDRRNKGAPFASLAMKYEPLSDLEIGVRVAHARATARGAADAVDSAGGYLTFRY